MPPPAFTQQKSRAPRDSRDGSVAVCNRAAASSGAVKSGRHARGASNSSSPPTPIACTATTAPAASRRRKPPYLQRRTNARQTSQTRLRMERRFFARGNSGRWAVGGQRWHARSEAQLRRGGEVEEEGLHLRAQLRHAIQRISPTQRRGRGRHAGPAGRHRRKRRAEACSGDLCTYQTAPARIQLSWLARTRRRSCGHARAARTLPDSIWSLEASTKEYLPSFIVASTAAASSPSGPRQ